MKIKITAAILLASGTIFFGGCGYDKPPEQKTAPQAAPVRETRQTENTERVERKQEIGEPLNTSIEVTKNEMDSFIDVAKNYRLTENGVRKLVQILKQIGFDTSNSKMIIDPVWDKKFSTDMRLLNVPTPVYKIYNSKGLPPDVHGDWILTFGEDPTDSVRDFEIYFKFNNDDICPMYKSHRVVLKMSDCNFEVSDDVWQKIYDTIAREISGEGKVVEMRYLQYKGINIDALKVSASFTFKNNAPCVMVSPDVVIESNVYGEGRKTIHTRFFFRLDGTFIKRDL